METKLILFVSSFIFFLMFLSTIGLTGIISSESPENLVQSPLEKDVCVISGWDAPIDAISCAVENVKYFSNLIFVSTDYPMLNYLIFLPVSVTVVYVVVKLIRGGG